MQIRCLLEGVSVEEMLERWHDLLPEYMQRWQLDRGEVRSGRWVLGVAAAVPWEWVLGRTDWTPVIDSLS